MMTKLVTKSDTEAELKAAFQVFDRDGSGTISAEELRNVMKSLGENLTDDQIDEMIREADKDGDGSIDCEFLFSLHRNSFQCITVLLRLCYRLC